MNKKLFYPIVFVLFISLLGFATAGAVTKTFKKARSQVYFGLTVPYNTYSGDFNGDFMIRTSLEDIYIPDLDNGVGFGVTFGLSGRMGPFWTYAVEAAYQHTSLDYTFADLKDDAGVGNIDINVKGIYSPQKIQPYALLGISIPYINVSNGAAGGFVIDDAKFRGVGINFGAGADLYISPRVFLNFNIMYRAQQISTVEGIGDSFDISGNLDHNNLNVSAGIMYAIPLD